MTALDDLMRKCQEQEERIKGLEAEIDRLAAFLLNVHPDKIGSGDYERGESAVDVAIRLLTLQPCGHPNACIVQGDRVGPGMAFTYYCGWCQSLDVARWQERARCIEIARSHGEEWGATSRGAEARSIASAIAEQDVQEVNHD